MCQMNFKFNDMNGNIKCEVNMKCIKEKCEAFRQHDFNASCFKCIFESWGISRKKDGSPNCIIEAEMHLRQLQIDGLRKTCEEIKSAQ